MDAKVLEGINSSLELKDMNATLNDLKSFLEEKFTPVVPTPKPAEDADMGESAVAGITDFKIMAAPIGQAIVGGFSSVFVSELVDGFLVSQGVMVTGLVKIGAAVATLRWGKRILGKTGAMAAALLLTYDGARDILPIDQWATRGADAITGVVTTRGLGGNTMSAITQANKVADNYYPSISRRSG